LSAVGTRDPALLVGLDPADDAAVYLLAPDLALVQSIDFFTPILDDPFDWGRVAAANALSDIYAMGGRPILCLNVVGWPRGELGLDVLSRVLEGGVSIAAKAGAVVAGGHSIDDPEPKFGMAVTGVAHPDHLLRISAAQPGDRLILTKPLGTGILSSALKEKRIGDELVRPMVEVMTALNDSAARAAHDAGCRAATDVTGYGLLGHLREMLEASGCAAEVNVTDVPVLDGTRQMAAEGVLPGGSRRNLEWVGEKLDRGVTDDVSVAVLADAQTSGGLLICWPEAADPSVAPPGPVIGRVVKGRPGHMSLR
jgi:selenide, water dikinase